MQGPRIEDVTLKHYPPVVGELELGPDLELEAYEWVPDDVVVASGAYEIVEPKWLELPRMSFMEFYQVRAQQHMMKERLYVACGATLHQGVPCCPHCHHGALRLVSHRDCRCSG